MCGAEARVSKRKGSGETRVLLTVGSTVAKAGVEHREQSRDLSLGCHGTQSTRPLFPECMLLTVKSQFQKPCNPDAVDLKRGPFLLVPCKLGSERGDANVEGVLR